MYRYELSVTFRRDHSETMPKGSLAARRVFYNKYIPGKELKRIAQDVINETSSYYNTSSVEFSFRYVIEKCPTLFEKGGNDETETQTRP